MYLIPKRQYKQANNEGNIIASIAQISLKSGESNNGKMKLAENAAKIKIISQASTLDLKIIVLLNINVNEEHAYITDYQLFISS